MTRKEKFRPLIDRAKALLDRIPKTEIERRHRANNLFFAARCLLNQTISDEKADADAAQIEILLKKESNKDDFSTGLSLLDEAPAPLFSPASVASRRAALEAELKSLS